MIDDAARRALIAVFPPGVAVAVYTTRPAFYVRGVARAPRAERRRARRGDGNARGPGSAAYVVVEGLDDLADPAALLRALRVRRPAGTRSSFWSRTRRTPARSAPSWAAQRSRRGTR